MPRPKKPASPFRYFNSSPEIIRLVVMVYVRFPLSLRKFALAHAAAHNHVNSERYLTDRQTDKADRSAALAEWQNLMA